MRGSRHTSVLRFSSPTLGDWIRERNGKGSGLMKLRRVFGWGWLGASGLLSLVSADESGAWG